MPDELDVFICHASEDKARFVEPLVAALEGLGLKVWYDAYEIRLGDSFRQKMNEGLRGSRFGVVVVSSRSSKYWTDAELDALFNQEAHDERRPPRILPVRCDLTTAELTARDPLLAARVSVSWELGVGEVARGIAAVVRGERPAPIARSPTYGVPGRRAMEFVGREVDLDQLDALLVPGGRVRVAASVEGLAGVGKTELAMQMVDRLARTDRFPGGIYWLAAEQPDLTPAWGGDLADALAVAPGTMQERAVSALRVVSGGGAALIVLDNAESWTSDDAPHPLPTGPHIAVLVTTRQRRLGGSGFKHLTSTRCTNPVCRSAPADGSLTA